jgi:nucleotide-binding universal stress UspA family protein
MTDKDITVLKTNRILVAFDTSARGRAALKTAVRLALNTSAELQGLFVEDEDLVRLASLPFACEVDFASAASRQLQSVSMERALRAAAEETQNVFSSALRQLNLQWTFRIVRGTVTQQSLAAAADVDLLVIGQQGRSPRIMAGEYLPKRSGRGKRVVAVFDGSPSAFRTLELANVLADAHAPALSVLVLAKNGDAVGQQCMSWLQQRGIRADVDQVLNPSEDALIDGIKKWPPSMLLINRDSQFISDSQICRLVNEFDCPLILC